jgi:hypothetical protein
MIDQRETLRVELPEKNEVRVLLPCCPSLLWVKIGGVKDVACAVRQRIHILRETGTWIH